MRAAILGAILAAGVWLAAPAAEAQTTTTTSPGLCGPTNPAFFLDFFLASQASTPEQCAQICRRTASACHSIVATNVRCRKKENNGERWIGKVLCNNEDSDSDDKHACKSDRHQSAESTRSELNSIAKSAHEQCDEFRSECLANCVD